MESPTTHSETKMSSLDSLGPTHIQVFTSKEVGKAVSLAEKGKLKKYRHLNKDYHVIPVGIETLGSFGPHALNFIKDIGQRIMEIQKIG